MTPAEARKNYLSDAETPLSTQGAQRLLKLAAFLDRLPRQKFNFNVFLEQGGKPPLEALKAGKHFCGTVGCAIGWMPAVFPKLVKWSEDYRHNEWDERESTASVPESKATLSSGFDMASEVFGITKNDVCMLFNPTWDNFDGRRNPLDKDATPKAVARHIRKFVRVNYAGKATLDYGA